jgi:hypothetical protein
MSDVEIDTAANLEFFNFAVLRPAIESLGLRGLGPESIVSSFGLIEAASWAKLGVQIGYFDAKGATELIFSSREILDAWRRLAALDLHASKESWADIFQMNESGALTVNFGLFSKVTDISPETRNLAQHFFQLLLLLTSENIYSDSTHYFLEYIGWRNDELWEEHSGGMSFRYADAVQIASGFANVLDFWGELLDLELTTWHSGLPSAKDVSADFFVSFAAEALSIRGRCSNFMQVAVVDRYFILAGEFAGLSRSESPEWLDARHKAFMNLTDIMSFAVNEYSKLRPKEELWQLFTGGRGSLPTENKRKRAERLAWSELSGFSE